MGGTSFDVGVIRDGVPAVSADKEIGYGVPVRVPMIDIHTIGAGGGSHRARQLGRHPAGGAGERGRRARADLLRPRRRRADDDRREPPARPARTRPRCSAWRAARRARSRARRSSTRRSARQLGLDADRRRPPPSSRVANDKMAGAIRLVSLAERLRSARLRRCSRSAAPARCTPSRSRASWASRRCWCPRVPGITSALGCLVADVRHDFVRTINQDLLPHGRRRGATRSWPRRSAEGRRAARRRRRARSRRSACCTRPTCSIVGQTHVLTRADPARRLHPRRLVLGVRARLLGALRRRAEARCARS